MRTHRAWPVTVVLGGVIALSACSTPPAGEAPTAAVTMPGQSFGSPRPSPPEGQVIAQGMVMDVDGDVQLCLGAVAESYPPQCSGIPLQNWTWDEALGSESEGTITWGTFALTGTYDGETFTATGSSIPLALYDPAPVTSPTVSTPGKSDQTTLARVQDELPALLGAEYVGSAPRNGYLYVDVVWDDGALQRAVDEKFGPDVVVVVPVLHPVQD